MDYLKYVSPAVVYMDDKELELYPFVPGPPTYDTGVHIYEPHVLRVAGHVRGFDTDETKYSETKARIRIEDNIRVRKGETQIFRCTVVDAPREDQPSCCPLTMSLQGNASEKMPISRSLVAKAFDCEYYAWPNTRGSGDRVAERAFSREFAAYKFYYENNKTGYPHVMPQFYGGWVIKTENRYRKYVKHDDDHPKFRYVYLLLIEFIEGRSVESLCEREEDIFDPDWVGYLIPLDLPLSFLRVDDDSVTRILFDKTKRQLVIKQMLYGLVVGKHLGVKHRPVKPSNVFVSLVDGHTDELRVVFLGHGETEIWPHTEEGKTEGAPVVTLLPCPPHPYYYWNDDRLDDFHGWWPPARNNVKEYWEEMKERERQFHEWPCSDEVFGPVEEAEDVMAELERTGRDWPHPYPKLSTSETLDDILETRELEREEQEPGASSNEH
ncbi:hypothetical protein CSOJ01_07903 [Colletotrichum sojae]|uniref:Protein kinase domain-containing protein n=1 Tax=Colletotrichum sojae TaxID=2175907 RepID=A0A8H6J831_9PEZI|nr:hypothetical protein CSOJ01_07903 [Colletotrichum sojae]